MTTTFALLIAAGNPLEHVIDHVRARTSGGWAYLTNHMIMMVIAAGLMLIIFPIITKRYRSGELVPTGTRNFFEAIMMFIRNDVAKPVLGDDTDRFMPFLWTLFFFILFNNLLGLLPLDAIQNGFYYLFGGGGGSGDVIGHGHGQTFHPIYGTATANLWVTGALALVAWLVIQVSGIRANGIKNYSAHFLGGAPIYMAPVMIPVEIMGMLVKPVALAIRLFANMTAGHTLVAVLISFTTMAAAVGTGALIGIGIAVVIGTVSIMLLELFVAFLQAYIFTFLTSLFIGQLVVHEHEHHEDEGGHHDEKHEAVGAGDLTDYDKIPDAPLQAGSHMAG